MIASNCPLIDFQDRSRKGVQADAVFMICAVGAIETARRVQPRRRSHELLFTESQLLPPHTQTIVRRFNASDFDIALSKVHRVAKRRSRGKSVLPRCVRVHTLEKESQ